MTDKNLPAKQGREVASQRFTKMVMNEFQSVAGSGMQLTDQQKRLAQHLFIKTDAALKEAEAKRSDNKKPPVTWENVNLQKMALDSIHRIELGLDALLENHISPIAYLNGRTQKYDLDLRIGYSGRDYYRRKFAIDPPKQVIYHLVHENDELTYQPRDAQNPVENYTFKVPKPLDRGKVIGGFGYLVFEDETKNKFIPVSMAEILRAEKAAPSDKFWGPYRDRMEFKTIVNIVTHSRNMPTDPAKVNQSYYVVEAEELAAEIGAEPEVIEIDFEEAKELPESNNKTEVDEKKVAFEKAASQNFEPEKQPDNQQTKIDGPDY